MKKHNHRRYDNKIIFTMPKAWPIYGDKVVEVIEFDTPSDLMLK